MQRAHGVVASHPLRMRKALGSNASGSILGGGMLTSSPGRIGRASIRQRAQVVRGGSPGVAGPSSRRPSTQLATSVGRFAGGPVVATEIARCMPEPCRHREPWRGAGPAIALMFSVPELLEISAIV